MGSLGYVLIHVKSWHKAGGSSYCLEGKDTPNTSSSVGKLEIGKQPQGKYLEVQIITNKTLLSF